MTSDATPNPVVESTQSDPLAPLRALVRALSDSSRSLETRRSYSSAWRRFESWAKVNQVTALPASGETVAMFAACLVSEGRRFGTIARAVVAISQTHLDAGFDSPRNDPVVVRVLKGIRRATGNQQTPNTAIALGDLRAMVATLGDDISSHRDRAILTLGFATGLRRSELVALELRDVVNATDHMVVTIRRSKSDQERQGRRLRVEASSDEVLCPVRALRGWIEASNLRVGALFRAVTQRGQIAGTALNARTVARIVQRAARKARLSGKRFGAHSLRSGCATAAASSGKSEREIAAVLGLRTWATAGRYIRAASCPSTRINGLPVTER